MWFSHNRWVCCSFQDMWPPKNWRSMHTIFLSFLSQNRSFQFTILGRNFDSIKLNGAVFTSTCVLVSQSCSGVLWDLEVSIPRVKFISAQNQAKTLFNLHVGHQNSGLRIHALLLCIFYSYWIENMISKSVDVST